MPKADGEPTLRETSEKQLHFLKERLADANINILAAVMCLSGMSNLLKESKRMPLNQLLTHVGKMGTQITEMESELNVVRDDVQRTETAPPGRPTPRRRPSPSDGPRSCSATREASSCRGRSRRGCPRPSRGRGAPGPPSQQAPTWTTHLDDEGSEYFYNTKTGETRWTDPASPTEWVIHHTDDGAPYLYSTRTGETKWSEHAASPTAPPPGAERKEDDGAPDGGGGEAPAPAEEVEDGEAPVDGGGEAPPVEDAALVDVPLEVASDAVP